jgi:hypothetical protein
MDHVPIAKARRERGRRDGACYLTELAFEASSSR